MNIETSQSAIPYRYQLRKAVCEQALKRSSNWLEFLKCNPTIYELAHIASRVDELRDDAWKQLVGKSPTCNQLLSITRWFPNLKGRAWRTVLDNGSTAVLVFYDSILIGVDELPDDEAVLRSFAECLVRNLDEKQLVTGLIQYPDLCQFVVGEFCDLVQKHPDDTVQMSLIAGTPKLFAIFERYLPDFWDNQIDSLNQRQLCTLMQNSEVYRNQAAAKLLASRCDIDFLCEIIEVTDGHEQIAAWNLFIEKWKTSCDEWKFPKQGLERIAERVWNDVCHIDPNQTIVFIFN